MNSSDVKALRLTMEMLAGDRKQALESAKKLIGFRSALAQTLLLEVILHRENKLSARLAATYALGFSGDRASVPGVIRVMLDADESATLRAHAAEALGNLRDARALSSLAKVLLSHQPASLKIWCIYAIGEIGGSKAYRILRRFDSEAPRGRLRKELSEVLARLKPTGHE